MKTRLEDYVEQMIEGIEETKSKTKYKSVISDLKHVLSLVDEVKQDAYTIGKRAYEY